MTKTLTQATAFALAALVTFGTVAGANAIATTRYAAAERSAQVAADATQVAAVQRVVVIGHRANA
jgi:hypothetical protein